jgi:hypothetical protein
VTILTAVPDRKSGAIIRFTLNEPADIYVIEYNEQGTIHLAAASSPSGVGFQSDPTSVVLMMAGMLRGQKIYFTTELKTLFTVIN